MSATLKEMTECLKDLRNRRKDFEEKAKTLKAAEDDLCDRILMEMAAQGVKSVNIEGVAKIAAKDTYRYEFADVNKYVTAMFTAMLSAVHDGRPLVDCLLFQQRMSKSNFEDMLVHAKIDPETVTSEVLDQYGVRKVEERTLSLTKA